MTEFIPRYSKKIWLSVFYLVFVGIVLLVLFFILRSGPEDNFLLYFSLALMIFPLAFFTMFFIKKITFQDYMIIHRYILEDIYVKYSEIEYIGISYIKTTKKKIVFNYMKNTEELRAILDTKIKDGIIEIDPVRTEKLINVEFRNIDAIKWMLYTSIPIIIVLNIVLAVLGFDIGENFSHIVSGVVFFITYSIAYNLLKKRKYVGKK